MSPNPEPNPLITKLTLDSSVELCHQIAFDAPSDQMHGVVLADGDDNIVQRVVLEGDINLDHAIGWVAGFCQATPQPTVLFISALARCVECIDPLLMWEFDRTRWFLRHIDVELRDWLVDDGFVTRSLAYTTNPQAAWLGDPLPVRSRRLASHDPGLIEHGSSE